MNAAQPVRANTDLTSDAALPDAAMALPEARPDAARPANSLTARVVHGSLWNLGGQGVIALATLLATPVVIRLLGTESYGVLALINVLVGYLAFADFGMGLASTRFGAKAHALGDDDEEAKVIWTALLLAALPALLIALTLALTAGPLIGQGVRLPVYLRHSAVVAVRLAACGLFARALAGVLNTPGLVRLRMDLVVLVNVGTSVGQILLVPVALILGGGLTGAVAVVAGASALAALLHGVVGARLLPRLRRPRVGRELMKPLARFGGAFVVSWLAAILLANAEKLMLPRFASVRALAYYTVAFNISFMLTQAPFAMAQSLLPVFSQLQTNPDRTALRQLYQRALRGTLYWVAPAAIFIFVAARPFLNAWAGSEFGRESTLPLYILVCGLVFEGMAYVPYTLLVALGRTDLIARCHLVVLAPYLIASALLINRFGAIGAAFAWSLRAMASAAAFSVLTRRVSGLDFAPLPDNKGGYLIALTILLLPSLLACLFLSSALVRVCVALVALAAYSSLILTRVLTYEERKRIMQLLPVGRWRPD